jgi:hypothetical protein
MEYRLYWVNPQFPRIRGPVWETNRKLVAEKVAALDKEIQEDK